MQLETCLKQNETAVNRALARFLPRDNAVISRAMRYSMFAGGKRIRPLLVLEGARLCGLRRAAAMPAACALEYIHTYSLIHDDLPAMDDDDLRRGKPTAHRKFGEAAAILAGDALLTDAFRLLSLCADSGAVTARNAAAAIGIVADAAGIGGMIAGQAADTLATGAWKRKSARSLARALEFIHLNKTAALIRASLLAGATLAGADRRRKAALDAYGRNIGLAFQIADDVLDVIGDKKLLGKKGSDRDNDKLTFVSLYGVEESVRRARRCAAAAKRSLAVFGGRGRMLEKLADYIVERTY